MAAYSTVGDLLTGNVPTPVALDPQKFVNDATDEIDSKIGFLYVTPLDIVAPTSIPRPACLLIKRINNFLASGRLLLAAAAGQEDSQIHAYGWSLIKEATTALDQIATGQIPIEGAVKQDTGDEAAVTAIILNNLDEESAVEAFYSRIANPDYTFLQPSARRAAPVHGLGVIQ
jgi:hypothetical protein